MQTYNRLIKLAVIKNRSGTKLRQYREPFGKNQRIQPPLFIAQRVFPQGTGVKEKLFAIQARKKLDFRAATFAERKSVYPRKHANAGTCGATCAAALQFPGRLLIASERNGGYFARVCLQIGNAARKCSPGNRTRR